MAKPLKLLPAALAAVALTAATAHAAPGSDTHGACFTAKSWDGWSAPGEGDALYFAERSIGMWVRFTPLGDSQKLAADDLKTVWLS